MLDSTSLTTTCVALLLKVMVKVPVLLLSVPMVVPDSSALPALKLRLPNAENKSFASAPPRRASVTLAPA